jgi:8-oxo-dGTP diphosphatase
MDSAKDKDPRGGIGVFVIHPDKDKILIGKRKDCGLYAKPGGWLERYEEFEECGSRELLEEVGLIIPPERIFHISTLNAFLPEKNYHNVAIYLYCEITTEEIEMVKNMEPEKCEKWEWMKYEYLFTIPDQLFFPLKLFLDTYPNIKNLESLKNLNKI